MSGAIVGNDSATKSWSGVATIYLRLALGAGFLSAVADRFGVWGPPGAPHVAWGDWSHFLAYAASINPELPAAAIPTVGLIATAAEILVGVALIAGVQTRRAAVTAGVLLLLFALGMTLGTGIKSPLDASVFAASAGAFLLAGASEYPLSVDARWRARSENG